MFGLCQEGKASWDQWKRACDGPHMRLSPVSCEHMIRGPGVFHLSESFNPAKQIRLCGFFLCIFMWQRLYLVFCLDSNLLLVLHNLLILNNKCPLTLIKWLNLTLFYCLSMFLFFSITNFCHFFLGVLWKYKKAMAGWWSEGLLRALQWVSADWLCTVVSIYILMHAVVVFTFTFHITS